MEISVVIPVFNRPVELERALTSLVDQTLKDFEVVVIDDGSDSDLSLVISKFRNLRIVYEKIEHCGNIAFLRNKGFSLSVGNYIAVLDSDDICFPQRLEKQFEFLKKYPEIDVLAGWAEISGTLPEKNERLDKLYNRSWSEEEIVCELLNFGCCICNSTVMMRRSFLESLGGYDNSFVICEDSDLWLRALSKGKRFKVLEEKLITRTVHLGSVTEKYWGNPLAIKNVIKGKLNYLLSTGLISDKKIAIIGKNSRDDIVLDLLREIYVFNFRIIDFYNEEIDFVNFDYYFITEYDTERYFYKLFLKHNKKPVADFIYL